MPPPVDRDRLLSDYLRQNYNRRDRLAVVTIERVPGGRAGQVRHYFRAAEEIADPDFQRMLRGANTHQRDIYLTPNTLRECATGRTKADVDEIRHIYLDVDVGGQDALQRILKAEGMPTPHHVLETSPGKHQLLWQVEGFDRPGAESTLRNLAAAHGADPAVTDCSRVLRVPGFRNCKYDEPAHYVRDVQRNAPGGVYRPADFPRYPEPEQAPTRVHGQPYARGGGDGTISQSERDWAYALRHLERGEPAAAVARAIEEFRPDKPNPRYYAERTVSRAQAKLASTPRPAAKIVSRETIGMER